MSLAQLADYGSLAAAASSLFAKWSLEQERDTGGRRIFCRDERSQIAAILKHLIEKRNRDLGVSIPRGGATKLDEEASSLFAIDTMGGVEPIPTDQLQDIVRQLEDRSLPLRELKVTLFETISHLLNEMSLEFAYAS